MKQKFEKILKHLVEVKYSDRITPTGTPPHVHELKIIRIMHEDMKELSSIFLEHSEKMIDDVRTAIENNDIRFG